MTGGSSGNPNVTKVFLLLTGTYGVPNGKTLLDAAGDSHGDACGDACGDAVEMLVDGDAVEMLVDALVETLSSGFGGFLQPIPLRPKPPQTLLFPLLMKGGNPLLLLSSTHSSRMHVHRFSSGCLSAPHSSHVLRVLSTRQIGHGHG